MATIIRLMLKMKEEFPVHMASIKRGVVELFGRLFGAGRSDLEGIVRLDSMQASNEGGHGDV
jgi:hypothetical protein